jgi:two-component system, sensor histidine kinase YesM
MKMNARSFTGKRLQNIRISSKITIYYLILLTISISISGFCYYRINSKYMARKISSVSFQMLGSINANIDTLIDNTNNLSKTILSDASVQYCLRKPTLSLQRSVNRYFINLLETSPSTSAIYLFDNQGNRYGVDQLTVKTFKYRNIQEAPWYEEVIRQRGGYLLKSNAGDIFSNNLSDDHYISLIRVVNDLDTQKPLGILIVNLSSKALTKSMTGVDNQYLCSIIVRDEHDRDIVRVHEISNLNLNRIKDAPLTGYHAQTWKFGRQYYLISTFGNQYGWRIISVIPFDELSRELRAFSLIILIMIGLNGLLIFFGAVLISKLITTPIRKLLQSMQGVKKGHFERVDFETGEDEIGKLKDGYNLMIQEIQNLLERTIAEQKIIRQTELEVLQAQIKPHFLYNTFDAISSLALAGRSEDVYMVMKALGSYYRISLSKGHQIITVAEEMDIVKNYLIIQQVRYGDIFSVAYNLEEPALSIQVLKLILQPLVENALYHGIKPKGEKGHITVAAKVEKDFLILSVADDGVGMSPERLGKITTPPSKAQNNSFGLWGTIERLRIFYGVEDILRIETAVGKGTIITIHIPLKG